MKLSEGRKGRFYRLTAITAPPRTARRLRALGLNRGSQLQLLNRTWGGASFLILIRGTRLGLGRAIAEKLEVEETEGMKEGDS